MATEKIQKIFIYFILVVFLLVAISIGICFYMNHLKWQGYRNDPDKQKTVVKIEEILAKKNKTGDDLLTLGNSYYQLEENGLAISVYKKALNTEAKDVAGLNLVNAYIADKQYKNAEKELLSILKEKNYGDSSLYIKLADLYKLDWEGKGGDTLGMLMEAYSKTPNNVDILTHIAEYYADGRESDKAIEFYNKALEAMPSNEAIKQEIDRLSQ